MLTEETDLMKLIWKALSDPYRRQLLDLIREKPQTTGDLVKQFHSIGRCAIMKHLSVLERARLVIPKKKGKYRWNYINAYPIEEIYQRWVKKYEGLWAEKLIALKYMSELNINKKEIEKEGSMSKLSGIKLEIPIEADIKDVWNTMVNNTDLWWSKDFYTNPKTKRFVIEPKLGGKMYEDFGNDEGLIWASVIAIDSPNYIEFKGHLSPDFGGPALSFLKLSLKQETKFTILKLKDTLFGNISEDTEKELETGWKILFEDGFKKHMENS